MAIIHVPLQAVLIGYLVWILDRKTRQKLTILCVELDDLCRYCGHFRMSPAATEIEQSITWVKAYKIYKDRNTRPKLTKY